MKRATVCTAVHVKYEMAVEVVTGARSLELLAHGVCHVREAPLNVPCVSGL